MKQLIWRLCDLRLLKSTYGGTGGKSLSLTEINDQINELLKAAVQSEGVISLFDSSKSGGENFSLFDPAVWMKSLE